MSESQNNQTSMLNSEDISFSSFQKMIETTFGHKDAARGIDGTFMWLMEEVGELAAALRKEDRQNLKEEFADVFAWLATLANIADIDLTAAIHEKYHLGCPRCKKTTCECNLEAKP